MADDIVTRLRQEAAQCNASPCDCQCPNLIAAADEIERLRAERDDHAKSVGTIMQVATDEIERLRAALALAVGELSTHGEYTAWTPEMMMNQFLEEARRG